MAQEIVGILRDRSGYYLAEKPKNRMFCDADRQTHF
jgi:hypothetical protein